MRTNQNCSFFCTTKMVYSRLFILGLTDLYAWIVLKVYSHQLDKNGTPVPKNSIPAPNKFITSANQYVDKGAELTRKMNQANKSGKGSMSKHTSGVHVPPFSPQYCYTFKGKSTEQGAGKIYSNRAEIEILKWLKHREKQGIMH